MDWTTGLIVEIVAGLVVGAMAMAGVGLALIAMVELEPATANHHKSKLW